MKHKYQDEYELPNDTTLIVPSKSEEKKAFRQEELREELSSGKQELWTHALKHKDSMWKNLNRQAMKKW